MRTLYVVSAETWQNTKRPCGPLTDCSHVVGRRASAISITIPSSGLPDAAQTIPTITPPDDLPQRTFAKDRALGTPISVTSESPNDSGRSRFEESARSPNFGCRTSSRLQPPLSDETPNRPVLSVTTE